MDQLSQNTLFMNLSLFIHPSIPDTLNSQLKALLQLSQATITTTPPPHHSKIIHSILNLTPKDEPEKRNLIPSLKPAFDLTSTTHIITNSLQLPEFISLGRSDDDLGDILSFSYQLDVDSQPIHRSIYLVTPLWVTQSYDLNKLQPTKAFSPDPYKFFSGIVISLDSAANLPQADVELIQACVNAWGGQFKPGLTKEVTHLICCDENTRDYQIAHRLKHQLDLKIVLPHWFHHSVFFRKLISEKPFEFPSPAILQPRSVSLDPDHQHGLDGIPGTNLGSSIQQPKKPVQDDSDLELLSHQTATKIAFSAQNLSSQPIRQGLSDYLDQADPTSLQDSQTHAPQSSSQANHDTQARREFQNKSIYLASSVDLSLSARRSLVRRIQELGAEVFDSHDLISKKPEHDPQHDPEYWKGSLRAEQQLTKADMVICEHRSGWEFWLAWELHKTIGTLHWILCILNHSKSPSCTIRPSTERLLDFPSPSEPINGHDHPNLSPLTISNYAGSARNYLVRLIEKMHIRFTGSLDYDTAMVVAANKAGTKVEYATKRGIQIVNHHYIEECFQNWTKQSIQAHHVSFPEGVNLSDSVGQLVRTVEGIQRWTKRVEVRDRRKLEMGFLPSRLLNRSPSLLLNPSPRLSPPQHALIPGSPVTKLPPSDLPSLLPISSSSKLPALPPSATSAPPALPPVQTSLLHLERQQQQMIQEEEQLQQNPKQHEQPEQEEQHQPQEQHEQHQPQEQHEPQEQQEQQKGQPEQQQNQPEGDRQPPEIQESSSAQVQTAKHVISIQDPIVTETTILQQHQEDERQPPELLKSSSVQVPTAKHVTRKPRLISNPIELSLSPIIPMLEEDYDSAETEEGYSSPPPPGLSEEEDDGLPETRPTVQRKYPLKRSSNQAQLESAENHHEPKKVKNKSILLKNSSQLSKNTNVNIRSSSPLSEIDPPESIKKPLAEKNLINHSTPMNSKRKLNRSEKTSSNPMSHTPGPGSADSPMVSGSTTRSSSTRKAAQLALKNVRSAAEDMNLHQTELKRKSKGRAGGIDLEDGGYFGRQRVLKDLTKSTSRNAKNRADDQDLKPSHLADDADDDDDDDITVVGGSSRKKLKKPVGSEKKKDLNQSNRKTGRDSKTNAGRIGWMKGRKSAFDGDDGDEGHDEEGRVNEKSLLMSGAENDEDDNSDLESISIELTKRSSAAKKKKIVRTDVSSSHLALDQPSKSVELDGSAKKKERKICITQSGERIPIKLQNKLTKMGAKFIDSTPTINDSCTHLLTTKIARTEKFLSCILLGCSIVNHQWAVESAKANRFLDDEEFELDDPEGEKAHQFTLKNSIKKAKTFKRDPSSSRSPSGGGILDSFRVFLTPTVAKLNSNLLKKLILLAGGQVLSKLPAIDALQRTTGKIKCVQQAERSSAGNLSPRETGGDEGAGLQLIVSCKEDDKYLRNLFKAHPILRRQLAPLLLDDDDDLDDDDSRIIIFDSNLILEALLIQEVRFEKKYEIRL